MILSEFTKVILSWYMSGAWVRGLFQYGGFPSSHSAFVTSLLLIVGRKKGIDSVEFAISTVLASIVWYDTVAIRAQIGKQAEVLNILQELTTLSEKVGHSLIEVIGGIIFGAGITMFGIWWVNRKRT